MTAAIFDGLARQDLQTLGQGFGLLASVGLDHANDHVRALVQAALAGGEHFIGLAHAGGHADEDLQMSSLVCHLRPCETLSK